MERRSLLLALLSLGTLASPVAARRPVTPDPRVKIETSAGSIVIALDVRHAPITARNFLAYVDQKRFDGTNFYRAARGKANPREGLVQGGISNDMTRMLKPIRHEPTSLTGLHHDNGTVSMARDEPGTATGDFFIVVGDGRYLDATRRDPGFAAFGHVLSGMAVVRQMLAAPTFKGGWSAETQGQSIAHPIRIISARRLP